jgi:hypothetical protein
MSGRWNLFRSGIVTVMCVGDPGTWCLGSL